MRRFTLLFVLVAFVFSCGGEWPILQGVAWINMIRDYSRTVPVAQAVQMTLSGHYPCALCRALAERKQSQDTKALALFQHEKKMLSPELRLPRRKIGSSLQSFEVTRQFFSSWSESPPTPPPRSA